MKTNNTFHQPSRFRPNSFGVLLLAFASTHVAHAQTNTGTGPNPNVASSNGTDAALSITTGLDNTAYGRIALKLNTTGRSNTAIGSNALKSNISGNCNTAVGMSSLFSN